MTADAGQAYEVLPVSLTQDVLSLLPSRAAACSLPPFVAVVRQPKDETFYTQVGTQMDGGSFFFNPRGNEGSVPFTFNADLSIL